MSKSTLRVRAWASPWLVASITTLSLPAATISASSACSSSASGVVLRFSFGMRSSPIPSSTVPISPGRRPAARSTASARKQVVVLPSVPVTPMTCRLLRRMAEPRVGGIGQGVTRAPTTSCGIVTSGSSRSTTTASAPARHRLR